MFNNPYFLSMAIAEKKSHEEADRLLGEGFIKSTSNCTSLILYYPEVNPEKIPTIEDLISYGTRPFDAILAQTYSLGDIKFTLAPPSSTNIETATAFKRISKENATKIMTYIVIFAIIRGKYPSRTITSSTPDLPPLMKKDLSCNMSEFELARAAASFDLELLGYDLLKVIDLSPFPSYILQKLTAHISGYRVFLPFKMLKVRQDASPEAKEAVKFVKEKFCRGYHWEICAPTRSMKVMMMFPSIKNILQNLMLAAYKIEDLIELASPNVRVLHEVPVSNIRYGEWRTWMLRFSSYTPSTPISWAIEDTQNRNIILAG